MRDYKYLGSEEQRCLECGRIALIDFYLIVDVIIEPFEEHDEGIYEMRCNHCLAIYEIKKEECNV